MNPVRPTARQLDRLRYHVKRYLKEDGLNYERGV